MSGLAVQAHTSVLYQEVLDGLAIQSAGFYIDGTFGRGGHSLGILQRLNPQGLLLGIDRDADAIAVANELEKDWPNFTSRHGVFAQIPQWVTEIGRKPQGIVLDLGVSSPQLDQPERGFSFSQDGPLDMRMDARSGETAAEKIAAVDEKTLTEVLWQYGEERYARRIAKAIVQARNSEAFVSTLQLAEVIKQAHPRWQPGKHPATRSFQALRIWVNNELGELQAGLLACASVLNSGARLAVISFHSLEDRLVKRFFRGQSFVPEAELPWNFPVIPQAKAVEFTPLGEPYKPTSRELAANPRARSAVLRIAIKRTPATMTI
jgi:16S rRNA (cytosine1402-N4)-methyltransferase